MSAPLVVNTTDGTCWTRRAVTRGGLALYAVAGVCDCPEFVMATLAELAEHGIAGSADVLPMPVGPEPPVDSDRAKAPWGRAEDGRPYLPSGAHWTDIPELVDRTLASIQARVDQAQPGSWYTPPVSEKWRAPGTVCTQYDGYNRTVGQVTHMRPADLELILHAGSDLSWCLDMVGKLRARVAELEAANARITSVGKRLGAALVARTEELMAAERGTPQAAEPADKVTALFAPTQALRLESGGAE